MSGFVNVGCAGEVAAGGGGGGEKEGREEVKVRAMID